MKITNIRLRQFENILEHPEYQFEGKGVSPTGIYPRFKGPKGLTISLVPVPLGDGRYRITHTFVQIDTDEGVSGLAGPISNPAPPFYIDTQIKPLLLGQDPLATEYLWDIMYRTAVDGRKGENMHAVGYVDIALWDIKSKWLAQPLYRLLGGPVQQKIPAYANMFGYSLEPGKVRERITDLKEKGYTASKWYPIQGPADGPEGVKKVVELMKTIREASGPDMEIMIDVWNSWDLPYTLQIAKHASQYDVSWIEEPLMPDLLKSYSKLTALSPVPISGGEHEYTRWGFKALLDMEAMNIYQPDIAWCGGISEAMKICAIASAYDARVVFHGSLTQVTVHMSCACSPMLTGFVEYLVIISEATQFFLKNPLRPVGGVLTPPAVPGAGMDLDENKIESEREITFRK
jgi:L-rhamnonate dehydratase